MVKDYVEVTEIAGDEVTTEQIERLCHRYYWAGKFSRGNDVVEVACGSGQGLGYLLPISKSIEGADISEKILNVAREHYQERIQLKQFDVQKMPYEDASKDVVLLFEAIYYIRDTEKFVKECMRILRPNGKVLIVTANKDLYDFNPSPHSHNYYGVVELIELFSRRGFKPNCFGYMPVERLSIKQKILRPVKKTVVSLGLMPKTMRGKKLLKRLVFGKMVKMPDEITENMIRYEDPVSLEGNCPNRSYKVIYCVAERS